MIRKTKSPIIRESTTKIHQNHIKDSINPFLKNKIKQSTLFLHKDGRQRRKTGQKGRDIEGRDIEVDWGKKA